MSTIRIPAVLRDSAGGAREVSANGATVSAVLDDLFRQHPALRDRVTEDGQVSQYLNVYVNDRDVRHRDGLDTQVGPDDTVVLLPAMAGGSRRVRPPLPARDAPVGTEGITIPRAVIDAMLAHAVVELPNEACGILSGSFAEARAIVFHPTRNSEESPLRYNVDPADLMRVTYEIDDAAMDIVGIFHSHVESPAVPSETDRRLAFYPEAFHVLVGLTDRESPEVRAWRIVDGDVVEADLTIE